MFYKVIKHFTDLQDNNHPYHVGNIFPRDGVEVSEDRLAELAGRSNKQGMPLIQAVEDAQPQEAPKKKRAKKTAEQ